VSASWWRWMLIVTSVVVVVVVFSRLGLVAGAAATIKLAQRADLRKCSRSPDDAKRQTAVRSRNIYELM
jgi:hypothetical protein